MYDYVGGYRCVQVYAKVCAGMYRYVHRYVECMCGVCRYEVCMCVQVYLGVSRYEYRCVQVCIQVCVCM